MQREKSQIMPAAPGSEVSQAANGNRGRARASRGERGCVSAPRPPGANATGLAPRGADATSLTGAPTRPRSPLRLGPSQILVLAFWFGILTGLSEIAASGLRVFCGGQPIEEWPEILWMAPAADILLLVVPSVLIAFGAWLRPGIGSLRLVLLAYLSVTFACLLFQIPDLSGYAKILLAVGMSTQASYFLARYPQRLSRLIDCTTRWARLRVGTSRKRGCVSPAAGERGCVSPAAGERGCISAPRLGAADGKDFVDRRQVLVSSTVTVAGLAAAVFGWDWWRERHALAGLPPADPDRPNVLFLVLDTVRAQSLSLCGYGRPTTPNLERLAKQGVTFRRAIASTSWTLPSHATMFTGRWLRETGMNIGVPLKTCYPTLAEVLSAQGYQTAGFVANTGFLCPAYGLHRGFAHYDCFRPTLGQILRGSALAKGLSANPKIHELTGWHQALGRKTAAAVNQGLVDWLERKERGRPFFAFVNYFDAHYPYIPSSEAVGRFGLRAPKNPAIDFYRKYTAAEIDALQGAYNECVFGLDAEIGRLMKKLKDQGNLENTVVLITSDHGEHFGEHGLMEHACSLYTQLIHVPLIILHPGRAPAGEVISKPVSLRDLPASILDLIGLKDQGILPGNSLRRFWEGGRAAEATRDRPILSELFPLNRPSAPGPIDRGPMQSLVWRDYHYIRNGDRVEELYHTTVDPLEATNLATSPAAKAVLERMRAGLDHASSS
jgi:arylsulfatase A-like enzyme